MGEIKRRQLAKPDQDPGTDAARTLKIGYVSPTTGPLAGFGEAEVVAQNPNFSLSEIDLRPDYFEEPRRLTVGIDVDF